MPSATPATAKPPFNFPSSASADVLIRTADNVNFYLLKAVLTQASPFFNDMFSIQQPELPIASGAILDTEDPIPVTENSQTFDYLMRLCYPVDYPVIKDLSLVESVLEAAIKYQMSEAAQLSRAMLRTFVQAEPLDVYAISCRLDVEEEAQLAAGAWKTTSFFRGYASQFEQTLVGASFGAKMRTITAGQYYRLMHYLCMRPPSMVRFIDGGDPTGSRNVAAASGSSHKWNATPLHDTTKTDAVLISQDGVKFPVHSAVLYAASAGELMDPLLAELQPSVEPHAGSPPSTFPVDLPSDVLAELVRLCYPMERFNITDLSLLCPVYAAAVKWRITRISSVIRNEFDTFIKRHPNPISLYFIAVMQGWRAEAELATRVIAQKGLQHLYAREMEDSCATTYYHLLRFCHDSSVSVEAKLSNLTLSCTLLQRSPPSAKSLTYTIIANEVTGLSPRSAQSSSKFCSHGYFQDNCPYACSLKKRFADLLEQGRRWEQRFTELLSEPKVKLRFHLE